MTPWTTETQFGAQSALVNDRRRHERTEPLQDGIHVWLKGNRRVRVDLIDESPGGIGVLIPDMSFSIGPIVELDYEGESRTAIVAYLNKQDNGYRLGLEWIELREV